MCWLLQQKETKIKSILHFISDKMSSNVLHITSLVCNDISFLSLTHGLRVCVCVSRVVRMISISLTKRLINIGNFFIRRFCFFFLTSFLGGRMSWRFLNAHIRKKQNRKLENTNRNGKTFTFICVRVQRCVFWFHGHVVSTTTSLNICNE